MEMQKDTKLSANKLNVSADTRRNFLKKASIGAPILLATSTKPAWGVDCMSGMMSGNLSKPAPTCDLSGGLSHGHWRNHYVGSPTGTNSKSSNHPAKKAGRFYYKKGQSFVYSKYSINSNIGNINFLTAITAQGNDVFGREIVTALINADMSSRGGVSYPYSIEDVESIYMEVVVNKKADEAEVGKMLESIHS